MVAFSKSHARKQVGVFVNTVHMQDSYQPLVLGPMASVSVAGIMKWCLGLSVTTYGNVGPGDCKWLSENLVTTAS